MQRERMRDGPSYICLLNDCLVRREENVSQIHCAMAIRSRSLSLVSIKTVINQSVSPFAGSLETRKKGEDNASSRKEVKKNRRMN